MDKTRMRCGLRQQVVEADQPGYVEHPVVHLTALGAPRNAGRECVEQVIGARAHSAIASVLPAGQPTRADVDPGAVAQVASLVVVEERFLNRQTGLCHGHEFIAQAFEVIG